MTENKIIQQCLKNAVEELNEQLPPNEQLKSDQETPILGSSANLDSLGFLNLVLNIEMKLSETSLPSITLVEKLMQEDPESIQTLGDLAIFVESLILQEKI